ncbi:hypothetical protein [Enterococcus sp. LJL90]
MVVSKTLNDYIEDGSYTIVVSSPWFAKKLRRIYPEARISLSNSDGIGGKKLLIDYSATQGPGLLAALGKFRDDDIVVRRFTDDFIRNDKPDYRINERLSKDDISYDLNGEVPKLYIKGKEVGVVSMTMHYVTASEEPGTKTVTFVYLTKGNPENKVLSINNLGEVFNQ